MLGSRNPTNFVRHPALVRSFGKSTGGQKQVQHALSDHSTFPVVRGSFILVVEWSHLGKSSCERLRRTRDLSQAPGTVPIQSIRRSRVTGGPKSTKF